MPFREDLLTPIAGDNPSGGNLRYDPVTDKLKEARREDIEAPQGAWKSALKVADYAQVIQLAGEAIAKRGKDLQIATWLVDAHVRREGFAALAPGFRFLQGLLEQFWDTLYPEIEDGDAEVRAAVLEWLGSKLGDPIRTLPVTTNRLSFNAYKDSRTVGYESEATTDEKRAQRQAFIDEGKLTAEEFDQAADETPKGFYENLHTALEDALAALASLGEMCDSRFGDVSPSFVKTRTAIEEIDHLVKGFINKKGGATSEAAPEATPVELMSTESAVPAGSGAARVPVAAGGIEPISVEDAARRLGAIARYLRQQDVYHIGPYLVLRGLRWGEIRYNGPQIDATMMEPPSAELRKQLKQHWTDGDWDKVLETTETAMELPCGRAWLDVQRYAVKALEQKGEYFQYVAGAVRTELKGLLADLPGLLEMTLADDTPTANPETQAWIRQEILPQSSATGVESAAPAESAREEPAEPVAAVDDAPPSMGDETAPAAVAVPDVFDLAMEAARQGRVSEAIQMLSGELKQERSGRARFKRRMQLAHLFMISGHEKIAYPILEELADEIERRGLEDWEPGEVLAYPLSLLMKCLATVKGTEEKRQAIYARICRIHPEGALNGF
jgi:type VI secretion system protein ImpA